MAAVAPYLVSVSVKELCSAGVSNRLAVKWVSIFRSYVQNWVLTIGVQGIFREDWIQALLVGQEDLGRHDFCILWCEEVKPRLRERLFTPTGLALISVHQTGDRATVQSIWAELIEWLRGDETNGIACCVAELEHWARCTLKSLARVQFPI